MATKKTIRRIPPLKTYEEEALFWDTHSPEEFPEEFRPVKAKFRRPLQIRLAVPLEQETVKQMEQIGAQDGMEPVSLARQWILERIAASQR